MASLYEKYDRVMRKDLKAFANWMPGDALQIGDILIRRNGQFTQIGHVSEFGVTLRTATQTDKDLDFASESAKQRVFQFGVETDADDLDLSAEASVKFEFSGSNQFILKTPSLSGYSVQNELEMGQKLGPNPSWKHDKYFIVTETYGAADWIFLGKKQRESNIEFSGKGAGILSLVKAGISAGLKSKGTVELKLSGKGGNVAMNLVRVREDGSIKPAD